MPTKRLRLVRDDSCHWYVIPADKRKEFDNWVASFEDYNEEAEEIGDALGFDEMRLNMHPSNYTFTDLQEDK